MAPNRTLTTPLAVAFALATALSAAPVAAQDYVRAECRPLIGPDPLASDPASTTARWYRRFWTGNCDGLFGCFGGSPNWNEVVGRLVGRSAPADRAAVLAKACRLGPQIGLEWTRPKSLRRIDTGELRRLKSTLDAARDVPSGLDRVEAEVRAKLGR